MMLQSPPFKAFRFLLVGMAPRALPWVFIFRPFRALLCRPFRALRFCRHGSQGVALGFHIPPFQGTPMSPFQGFAILSAWFPGRCPGLSYSALSGRVVCPPFENVPSLLRPAPGVMRVPQPERLTYDSPGQRPGYSLPPKPKPCKGERTSARTSAALTGLVLLGYRHPGRCPGLHSVSPLG
jgi:hypothetical protein